MIQQIGRLGKFFVKSEGSYATAATLAAGDALRHLDVGFTFNRNRQNSMEKKGTPGLTNRFSRHITAGFALRSAYLSPSGTIKTVPEAQPLLVNGLGVEIVGAGATTVASGSSSTVFDVASGDGADFTVGEMIAIRRAANASRCEPRLIVSIATDTITVEPALGGTPASGDTVKNGVTYKLANDLPASLTMARYLPDVSYQLEGAVVEKIGFTFDGNDEAKFRASGPAAVQTRPAQSEPGGFTTVGDPVTGILGNFVLNGVAYKITRFDAEVNNMTELINDSLGTDRAEGFYRNGRRDITLAVDARLTDDEALYALAEAASDATVLCHVGNTEGKVVACYAPRAEFDIPDVPDDDGAIRWSFKGVAKEKTSGAGNDELIIAFL